MKVYVDVLVVLNMTVDYLILFATEKFMHIRSKPFRILLGALAGGISSLYIFAPIDSNVADIAVNFVFACMMILITFGFYDIHRYIRLLTVFYIISFVYSGVTYAVWTVTKSSSIIINNSVVYFDISPMLLIAAAVIGYSVMFIIRRFAHRSKVHIEYDISVSYDKRTVKTKAFFDSGSNVTDAYSNNAVIVMSEQLLHSLCPNLKISDLRGYRLLPYKAVGKTGLIEAFLPDQVYLNETKIKDVTIAVTESLDKDKQILVGPKIIELIGDNVDETDKRVKTAAE